MVKTAKKPNAPAKTLAPGIPATGRSRSYHQKGLWAIKKQNGGKFPKNAAPAKAEPPATKGPKFYPPEDVVKLLATKRKTNAPTKLRASITPGTVLILLAGRFKGKRVIFLKQLDSGLLLITGPFKVNGVPLRRVNQAYVIATSTKIDVSTVDCAKFDDKYFKKTEKKEKNNEKDFTADPKPKEPLSAEYMQDQADMDTKLRPLIAKVSPQLEAYLGERFTLKHGMKPHEMKF